MIKKRERASEQESDLTKITWDNRTYTHFTQSLSFNPIQKPTSLTTKKHRTHYYQREAASRN